MTTNHDTNSTPARIYSPDRSRWATQYAGGWTVYDRDGGHIAAGLSQSDALAAVDDDDDPAETVEHDPACVVCVHDCPWQRHHIGAPYCQVCDDHAEARDAGYGTTHETDPDGFAVFLDAYVAALLWSSVMVNPEDPDGEYLNADDYPEGATLREDLRPDAVAWFDAWADYWRAHGWDDGQAGHDFALTRNGHGTGYWDRGYPDPDRERAGRVLTDACRPYGETYLYLGDDGMVYVG